MEKCEFIDTSRLMIRLFWGWDGIHFKGFNFDVVYYFNPHFHLLACFTTFLRGDISRLSIYGLMVDKLMKSFYFYTPIPITSNFLKSKMIIDCLSVYYYFLCWSVNS